MTTENDTLPPVPLVRYRRFLEGYPLLLARHPDLHSFWCQHPVVGGVAKADGDILVVFLFGFYSQFKRVDAAPSLTLKSGEALGVVCPVYAWAVPRLVDDYVKRLSVNENPAYCYLACTCGDSLGKTPERFAKTLRSKGWHLDAAFGFVMPETYINLKGFNLDTPESEKRKIDSVRRRLPEVAERIKRREQVIDVVRGPVPVLTSYVANPLFYGLLITDKKFHATDACIHCGKCEQVCPLNNIDMVDGKPHWNGRCTNCMACYHHCPKNAIHFGKATLGKGQYYFGRS